MITQSILNYSIIFYDGMSQNWAGPQEMNPRFTHINEYAWRKRSIDSSGDPDVTVLNVLLLDFVGEFDNFPEMFMAILHTPDFPRRSIASGSQQILRNNYFGKYIHKPKASGMSFYGYAKSVQAGCELHEIERDWVLGTSNQAMMFK